MEKKKLYLVDVSSMFFRAYYAIRELRTSEGLPTNALYGFLSMTTKLLNEFQPKHMVYCLDRKEPSFRKDLDPNYKANRSEMPEDLATQIPYIYELTDVLGIPKITKEGFEADDIIGTLAKWGETNDFDVVIVSGDKDFAQLINDNISMYDPVKKKTYTPDEVEKKWEVRPEHFIDYLAIVGDASDNIPGVKGIGPKGAVKLLKEFKNLENIYENLHTQKGATLKKLEDSKEAAFLSQKLVKIVTDIKLVEKKEELELKEINQDHLKELFTKLEFESFLKNFVDKKDSQEKADKKEVDIFEIKKLEHFKEAMLSLSEVNYLETDRGEYLFDKNKVYSVPYDQELLMSFGKTFDRSLKGFSIKPFLKKLGTSGIEIKDDLQLKCYSASSDNWDFKKAYEHFCGTEISDFSTVGDFVKAYFELEKALEELLVDNKKKLYEDLELPLLKVLLKMELEGILIDKENLNAQSEGLDQRIKEITEEVHGMVEKPFNLASPKQLSKVLFEELGIEPVKKTKTGFSTNTDVLEKLKDQHPIAEKIIEFRELSKLKSTYVDSLPKLINPKTGRVHTTYNQALTTTGRLSSVSPNLQNIPIKTQEGRKVRQAFVPKKGHVFLSADYSQIELRILAHISGDKALKEAFLKEQDVHSKTASEVFDVKIEEVTSEQRRAAKAVNFGIAYGQGAYGLSEALNIPRKEAKKIIENYFDKFESVKSYIDDTIEKAKKDFFVKTLLGRVREIKELESSNKMLQKFGERAAINAPIQGSASDLIKLAMIEVDKVCESPLLLQVHDELILEVPEQKVEEESSKLKQIMESIFSLDVPLVVNLGQGKNWDEAH